MALRRHIDRSAAVKTPNPDQEKVRLRKKALLDRLGKLEEAQEKWQRKLRRAFTECEKQRQTIKRLNGEIRKLEEEPT